MPPIPAGVEPVSAATRRARHAQSRSKSMEERRRPPPDLNGEYTKDGTPAKDLTSKRAETSSRKGAAPGSSTTKTADSAKSNYSSARRGVNSHSGDGKGSSETGGRAASGTGARRTGVGRTTLGTTSSTTTTSTATTSTTQRKKTPPVPPPKPKAKPPKTKPKPKPKAKPEPELVTICGTLQVPADVKSMKQRIKEELQIVTASRRLHLDEQQELLRMEREMEERLRERKLKADKEDMDKAMRRSEAEAKQKAEELRQQQKEQQQQQQRAAEARRKMTPPAATLTARMSSPQASPRRGRHKRQNSDPIIAKFSPIEEDRDIEADIQVGFTKGHWVCSSYRNDSLYIVPYSGCSLFKFRW